MKVETRKLQQVGHSTLMVSLPKEWVRATRLSQGDTLTIQQNEDGTLHILPIGITEKKEIIKCIVDADKCDKPGIIARIITGIYIIGHETLEIISSKGFESSQLSEIRQIIQRLTGMSVVEQDMHHVVIKNFVDPTRFPTNGLLRRVYIITSWMQEASIQALKENRKNLANEVIHMENEVDRIYWLVVRQMLLAIKDKTVEKKIGIESSLNIVGDRTIAKVLEKIGDYSENIANEVIKILDAGIMPSNSIVASIEKIFNKIHNIYSESTKSFFTTDLFKANDVLEMNESITDDYQKVIDLILNDFTKNISQDGKVIRERVDVYLSLRAILWNFTQIASYSATIAEITINRALEKPSETCKFESIPSSESY